LIQKQTTAANTNVYRCWDDLEKTIMMMGPGTFTLQDRDDFDIEHLTGKEAIELVKQRKSE